MDTIELFHGTSSHLRDAVMTEGLVPRKDKPSLWDEHPSHADFIYLTSAYAYYFAEHAATRAEEAGVEDALPMIVCTTVQTSKLFPDEDFMAQVAMQVPEEDRPFDSLEYATSFYREAIFDYQNAWDLSLENMGTIAHHGEIPAEDCECFIVPNNEETKPLIWEAIQPSISVLNFKFCGERYIELNRAIIDAVK